MLDCDLEFTFNSSSVTPSPQYRTIYSIHDYAVEQVFEMVDFSSEYSLTTNAMTAGLSVDFSQTGGRLFIEDNDRKQYLKIYLNIQ